MSDSNDEIVQEPGLLTNTATVSLETNIDRATARFRAKRKCRKCHGKGFLEFESPNVLMGDKKMLNTHMWVKYDTLCECVDKTLATMPKG